MTIYCLADFKREFDKLLTKKPYKSLENDIIDYFFGKETLDLLSGTRLNNSDSEPYIKKRLNGSGGFRFYFLIIIKQNNLYLMFVHPKTGPNGAENITDESKALIYKKVIEGIKSNDLYKLTLSNSNKNILFDHLSNAK